MTSTLQGIAVSPTPPTVGQVLTLAGGLYVPTTPGGGGGMTLLSYLRDNTSITTNVTFPTIPLTNMNTGPIATGGGDIVLQFDCDLRIPVGSLGAQFFLYVDGANVGGKSVRPIAVADLAALYQPVSLGLIVQGLAAGNHTFEVWWESATANNVSTNSYGGPESPTVLQVWEV